MVGRAGAPGDGMSGMDGARSSARRNAWQKINRECPCGRVVHGNGKAHERTCEAHLRKHGWPLDAGMVAAIHDFYPPIAGRTPLVGEVERRLGAVYLERRAVGDKTELPWREYRDLVWQFADEARGA